MAQIPVFESDCYLKEMSTTTQCVILNAYEILYFKLIQTDFYLEIRDEYSHNYFSFRSPLV